uniref:PGG domain-containing protein n=1 Tax=Musa acuminata subsp. malaccensis TaxID=214687 RepID=A0A804L8Z9_MUSAM|nr:PREDICTED: ankyrin repeat-containing protein At5g02620-like [Musa acuminata subsp. malaccensis]XP_009384271.1 PREDICTED: ankyrin repeat-containing protein At5g02620-like [Musa acuminata subsp. malaccensis]
MERQQSFRIGALEKLQSFRVTVMEKQKSFRMDKQRSFRMGDRQQSFKEGKSKESPGKRGDLELHLAARAGNAVRVHKVLSECSETQLKDLLCKQNQDGETALYIAAEKGHVEVVQEILKVSDTQSAAIKANNSYDSFHIAAKQGHLEVLKDLLRSFPALAMTTNSLNSTALDTAATQGHIDVVNLLLETDASLAKIARNNGKTVLHSAARMGHVLVVKSLLDKDPSIGLRTDKKGQTAFHMAVKGQNVEMVMELLKPDISIINLEDNKGNKPLHIATRKGNPKILQVLLSVKEIDINAVNRAGETALSIAEKFSNEEIASILREFGAVVAQQPANTMTAAKQLKQTVSDIKHDVQSQLRQTRQTEMKVYKIKKRLKKLHLGGLNNAINSNTVVAVLIATVAFAAIFQLPGQFVQEHQTEFTLGQAYIAKYAAFIIFLVSDSLALFISLAVVVVQTSLIVVEQKAKSRMVFVMNKLMWLACLFISVAFISLTYVVVGHDSWLAWSTMAIGTTIMLTTLGSMCYFVVAHRIEEKNMRNIRRNSGSRSRSWSLSVGSDSEILNSEFKKMYAL